MLTKTLTSLLTKSILIAVLGMAFTPLVWAQGLVSSGIAGSISDESGRAVSNATVTAVHVPTNSTYTAISGPNGRFRFSGLRVGGPYTVSAVSLGASIAAV